MDLMEQGIEVKIVARDSDGNWPSDLLAGARLLLDGGGRAGSFAEDAKQLASEILVAYDDQQYIAVGWWTRGGGFAQVVVRLVGSAHLAHEREVIDALRAVLRGRVEALVRELPDESIDPPDGVHLAVVYPDDAVGRFPTRAFARAARGACNTASVAIALIDAVCTDQPIVWGIATYRGEIHVAGSAAIRDGRVRIHTRLTAEGSCPAGTSEALAWRLSAAAAEWARAGQGD